MPCIEIRGRSLFYDQHPAPGSPIPPLLLIHAAGGQRANWPPQVRRLRGVHTIAPDLPGHGRSAGAGRETIGDYASDMLALADALGIEWCIPVGHSMGGAVALQMALDAPERVAGLGLVATGARLRVSPAILDNILGDYDAAVEHLIDHEFGPRVDDNVRRLARRQLRELPPRVLHGDYVACDAFDVRDRLPEISVPALVVGGSEDRMTPPKYARYLSDHLPNATLVLLEGGGHMIPAEFPDELARILWEWLADRFE